MNEKQIGIPLIGDEFPEINVQTTHGKIKLPEYYKGKWFVLFSHPADFTPVCTTEFVAFAKRHKRFKKMNTELIGLSIDQVFSHIKWSEWIKENLDVEITFPIIADHGSVAEKLGMVHPGKGSNTVRAVFIVDDKGVIRTILYYPQEIGRNMEEILRAVKALQTSDINKVAMPANWPDNELLKDRVIVPPAKDVETVKKRKEQEKAGEIKCYDWWLCHKKLD
jgi:peroxiredoxin (alkyl hydroperoxide reductase subunit C)